MRSPATTRKPRTAKSKSFPAPVRGWIANEGLARPKPGGAMLLENWFPTATGIRMRSGSELYATVGDGSAPVASLFSFSEGNNEKLFAATASAIYDITTVADSAVSPAAAVSTLTSGDWVACQFTTAGGTFLRLVNGADAPRVFDGTTWGTTPAITGATPEDLNYVWAFKNRLFFVEKNSLSAWYLPVDSIGGAAVELPLGAVFSFGGSLLFGSAWSLDTGSGLSEQCVFVTTEGEVAVYQGSDPSSASTWEKVGVYRIGRPLGKKAWFRAGGDLVIATDIGLIPLSQAIQRDVAALAPASVSYPIETEWNRMVADYSGAAWHSVVWPTKRMVLVAAPAAANTRHEMPVVNARTGAWSIYTGWRATCLQVFGERCFFGSVSGKVVEAEVGGNDQGATYTATAVPQFDDLKSPASLKIAGLARAVYLAPITINLRLSVQKDYAISLPPAPDVGAVPATNLWGTGVWGASTWATAREMRPWAKWQSVSGAGSALAVAIQITSGAPAPPAVELVRIDLTYDLGDLVT